MQAYERIGELLVEKGVITQEQLELALEEQKKTGEPIGKILIRFRFIPDEIALKRVLAIQSSTPLVSLEQLKPRGDQRLKEIIPKSIAAEYLILPLAKEGNRLKVAISKPPDVILLDNLRKITSCDILPVLATEDDVKAAIERYYSSTDLEEVVSSSAIDNASQLYISDSDDEKVDLSTIVAEADQAPVVKLVDVLLKKAVDDRASDIHIEPFYDKTIIRYRIDGILYELPPPPKQFHIAIVSRIKILAKLDIAEKRIPQDGAISIHYQARKIDIRVSTVPVLYGEKVVMRILDKRTDLLDLKSLGFDDEQLKHFETAIERPYGLIYVTGPTGSGKSTSLYAAINKRKSNKVNIMTIEDPVEYQIGGINQVQVKPEIGLTFATGLRAFLRQDPDVILVGETRDQETAEICIRAALTGHLVLSTLHTNDAPTAISRLADIGIKPYLVAGSILLIVAQRLVRRLCPKCKEPMTVTDKMRQDYKLKVDTIYTAKGCKECRTIGYWGRMAIYEVLPINEEMRHVIAQTADAQQLKKLQKEGGYGTLLTNGLKKVEQGLTSLEEVLSVAYE